MPTRAKVLLGVLGVAAFGLTVASGLVMAKQRRMTRVALEEAALLVRTRQMPEGRTFWPAGKEGRLIEDAWGRPVNFRRPGPIHTKGWDVWSNGPNRVDEQGHGDDIVLGGED